MKTQFWESWTDFGNPIYSTVSFGSAKQAAAGTGISGIISGVSMMQLRILKIQNQLRNGIVHTRNCNLGSQSKQLLILQIRSQDLLKLEVSDIISSPLSHVSFQEEWTSKEFEAVNQKTQTFHEEGVANFMEQTQPFLNYLTCVSTTKEIPVVTKSRCGKCGAF